MNSACEKKLTRCRTELVLNSAATMRFAAVMVLQLPWREVDEEWWKTHAPPGLPPTMATDGRSIFYHSSFVENTPLNELLGVVAHEAWHVGFRHHLRRGTRDPLGWNFAADARVNQVVLDAGLSLPSGGMPPERDLRLSVEEIYARMEQKQQRDGKGMAGVVFDCANEDGSPMSAEERANEEIRAGVTLRQALNAARAVGKFPAGIDELLKEVLEPVVPWREILARFVEEHNRNDYCWQRPSRRFVAHDMILPSLYNTEPAKIVMACDTSGSMSDKVLQHVGSEVIAVLAHYGERSANVELDVLWFDHAVYPQTVSDASELQMKGRGGTSFSVVFDYIREHELQPKGVIVLTDGECSDFGEAPECDVLWILSYDNRSFKPPFGEVALVMTL